MPREEIPVYTWGPAQVKKWVECQGFDKSERVVGALFQNHVSDGYVLMKAEIEDIIKTCGGFTDIRERTQFREALKELRSDNWALNRRPKP
jgi:hypothetical protein